MNVDEQRVVARLEVFVLPTLPRLLSAALLASFLALAACDDTVIVQIPGGAPPTRVEAIIEVDSGNEDPHLVDFGQVNAGDVRTREVLVRNVGTDPLQIRDLVLPSGASAFAIDNEDSYEYLLAPNTATTLILSYSPVRDETLTGIMQVVSNDPATPSVPVTLRAEGLAPAIAIDPPSFDFGNRELGCISQLEVTVANVGRAPLAIDDVWYEDLSGSGELSFQTSLQAGDELLPGESADVRIFYSPVDTDPDSGQLVVTSNDPSTPEARASQLGIASTGARATDEFLQQGNNSTDILFVVDNSCSMSEEQSYLASNFSSFLTIVSALDVDFHLGVTTTDTADNGQLVGTTRYITPNTPDPAGTFAANVNLGTSGSATEMPFQCGYLATQPANVQPGGYNYGFMRDEAGLRVVFVTDEEEQSVTGGPLGWNMQNYVDYFWSLKANPDHVVLSDVSGGLAGCAGAGGNASSAAALVQATAMSGGVSASICLADWASTLSQLGWLSQSFADTFELSHNPVPSSIEVRLNSVPVYVGWSYNAALNAVVFDSNHVPENGDAIVIEYSVAPDCDG